jgi:hypothetical protein
MFFQTKKHFKTQFLLYSQIHLFYRKHMVCPKNMFEGDIYIHIYIYIYILET